MKTVSSKIISVNGEETRLVMAITPEKETEKAIYVSVVNTSCGSNKMYWIPKSVITINEHEIEMKEWFFNQNFSSIK